MAGDSTGRAMSRRQLLVLGAAAAVGAAAGPWAVREVRDQVLGPGGPDRLVVPGKQLGIHLGTVRDAIVRRDVVVLDPRTGERLRGGFAGVFETLGSYGYTHVEFAGYDQGANGPIGVRRIRALLDEHGLKAVGAHVDLARLVSANERERELDRVQTLGAEWIGTASPVAPSGKVAEWQAAAERFNAIGEAAGARGLGFYHHTHDEEYDLFVDPTPDLVGVRRYQALLDWTDQRTVFSEMDVYWAYVARHRYPPDAHGRLFDPVAQVATQPQRYPLFHLQDAIRTQTDDGYTFTDVGDGVLYTDAFPRFLELAEQSGVAHLLVERENAPGASNPNVHDPGRSFRTARRCAEALLGKRAGPDDDTWIDPVPEEEHEHDEEQD